MILNFEMFLHLGVRQGQREPSPKASHLTPIPEDGFQTEAKNRIYIPTNSGRVKPVKENELLFAEKRSPTALVLLCRAHKAAACALHRQTHPGLSYLGMPTYVDPYEPRV